jgi:hypothetical protein
LDPSSLMRLVPPSLCQQNFTLAAGVVLSVSATAREKNK